MTQTWRRLSGPRQLRRREPRPHQPDGDIRRTGNHLRRTGFTGVNHRGARQPSQTMADAIKVDAGTTFTLTLPGPPPTTPSWPTKPRPGDHFLHLRQSTPVQRHNARIPGPENPNHQRLRRTLRRPLHRRPHHPRRTRHRRGIRAHRTVTVADDTGNQFLENFNFQNGVARSTISTFTTRAVPTTATATSKACSPSRCGTELCLWSCTTTCRTCSPRPDSPPMSPKVRIRRISRSTTTTPPANRTRSSTTNT